MKKENSRDQKNEMAALIVCVALATLALGAANPMDREAINPLQLSTFKGYAYDYNLGSNGAYQFFYSVPSSHRHEERSEDGSVRGSYSFVAPEGEEFDFKYQADEEGFKVQSDALPTAPQDTEEVRKAKEIFFEAYRKQLELVSEEEDDDDSDEESSESDEDDESSEESDEDDSSEESSEEDSEEDDDEDEDHEGQAEEDLKVQEFLRRGKDNRPAQESIFFKPAAHKFNKVSRSHRSPSSRSIRNSYKRQQN